MGERKKAIHLGKHPEIQERAKAVPFDVHARECLEVHYRRKRSYETAKMIVEVHLIPHFGMTPITAITTWEVKEYMAQRAKAGVAPATRNNERAILSKLFTLAVKRGFVYSNPVTLVEKEEVINERLRFLTPSEAVVLVKRAADHLKALIIAALDTGGRLSELLKLTWQDVDISRRTVRFHQTNTKSAKTRDVPMTDRLAEVLEGLRPVTNISGAPALVFTRDGKPLGSIKKAYIGAKKRAGLGKDVTFHTLRHTYASWFVMNGGSIFTLQHHLGHSDVRLTMRYAHLAPAYLQDSVRFVGPPKEVAVARLTQS